MKQDEPIAITFRLRRDIHAALERMASVRGLHKNTIINKLILGFDETLQKKIAAGGGNVEVYRKGVMLEEEFREAINNYWLSKLATLTKPSIVPQGEASAESNGAAEPSANAAA